MHEYFLSTWNFFGAFIKIKSKAYNFFETVCNKRLFSFLDSPLSQLHAKFTWSRPHFMGNNTKFLSDIWLFSCISLKMILVILHFSLKIHCAIIKVQIIACFLTFILPILLKSNYHQWTTFLIKILMLKSMASWWLYRIFLSLPLSKSYVFCKLF